MADLDEHYKQKYLKYKAKYMELKRYEQEGGLFDSGFGIVFTSKDNAVKLRGAFTAGKIGNKGDIANLLDRQAYIIFDGKKPAELLESTTRIMKDKMAAAATSVASATKTGADMAWNATKTGATMAASAATAAAIATANGAIALKDAGFNTYKEYNEKKEKEAADKAQFEKFKAQSTGATAPVAKLIGGGVLPLTIATLDNKSYDRANEAHKRHIAAAVAAALELSVDNIATVSIKFKMFGSPELRD
jgi:hypothetical protein